MFERQWRMDGQGRLDGGKWLGEDYCVHARGKSRKGTKASLRRLESIWQG